MFWKFNYLSSDLDNLLDKEVRHVSAFYLNFNSCCCFRIS